MSKTGIQVRNVSRIGFHDVQVVGFEQGIILDNVDRAKLEMVTVHENAANIIALRKQFDIPENISDAEIYSSLSTLISGNGKFSSTTLGKWLEGAKMVAEFARAAALLFG